MNQSRFVLIPLHICILMYITLNANVSIEKMRLLLPQCDSIMVVLNAISWYKYESILMMPTIYQELKT